MSVDNGAQVTERVQALYEEIGWKEVDDGVTYDAETGEDLRQTSRDYIAATRRRVLRHIPKQGDRLLDMASGPIQYPEYLDFSAGFTTRVCVDLSQRALDMARAKLGDHGEYLCGDFFEMDIPSNSMDAVVSLHTIYHIHESRQAQVVRKLVDVAKPGSNIVIVYSNPDNLVSRLMAPVKRLKGKTPAMDGTTPDEIYFKRFPLDWWQQFNDIADVKLYPWRFLSTPAQKAVVPSGTLGVHMLKILFKLEDHFPKFFLSMGCYPMIVLRKK